MARQRVYGGSSLPTDTDPTPMAFAKRLNQFMLRKGWKQSDLVRAAQNHMPEGQTFGRHLVSSYIRGAHMPNGVNLDAVAKALGVQITDLVPEGAATVVGHNDQAAKLSMSADGMARIKLDMELPANIALEILRLASSVKPEA